MDGYGAQIIPPHDAGIARCIDASLEPWERYECFDSAQGLLSAHPQLGEDCTSLLADSYYKAMAEELCRHEAANRKSELKVTRRATRMLVRHEVSVVMPARSHESLS